MTLLILGAVVVVVVVAIVVLSSGGGSPSKTASTAASITSVSTGKTHTTATHKKSSKSSSHAANPAETIVTVLNGTEKPNLAHALAGQLQQGGYSQAAALGGRPAGANQTTVVQYAPGHQADAEGVAHALGVSQVLPLEASVTALAGVAKVVVIVGADKAATIP